MIYVASQYYYIIQKPDQSEDDASKDDTDNTEGIAEYCTCENYDYCLVTEWLINHDFNFSLDREV